ncbi:unnamed protein product [Auanema sp. JU1783]|nr:unnamed protein product [Auanema sp. JU1783]
MFSKLLILLLACIAQASAQDRFELGKFSNVAESILERRGYAPKPTVPPEYRKFFELDGHARELVDSLLGPRPGGLFPEKTYEIGSSSSSSGSGSGTHQISNLERTLESFFTAPENSGPAFPGSFGGNGGGFSLINDNKNLAQFGSSIRRAPQKEASTEVDDESEGSGESAGSSIAGIPKVFPKIPLSPFLSQNKPEPKPEIPIMTNADAEIPVIATNPEVPEGGVLPTSDIRRAPQNLMTAPATPEDEEPEEDLADRANSSGGLIGTIFKLIGMTSKNNTAAAVNPDDKNALGRAVSNLIGGEDSPLPAKGMISNVLYNALTAPAQNSTSEKNNGTLVLTDAQSAAIGENLEMVKNLIIQPSSPLCTSKPEPVDFVLDSMMGQWYQVVYSPPLSSGPCSMVGYKKLSSVNDGGVGSIFEIFEYTTDGSQYAKPKISSGYAIIKSPGELIFRTTNNQDDVLVHVVHIGPVNSANEYEYVVMSTNCNYPIYVFARDPITYKQKYEDRVNRYLESANLVNGISRLFNIVAPVETSMCSFPPSLFNMAH